MTSEQVIAEIKKALEEHDRAMYEVRRTHTVRFCGETSPEISGKIARDFLEKVRNIVS